LKNMRGAKSFLLQLVILTAVLLSGLSLGVQPVEAVICAECNGAGCDQGCGSGWRCQYNSQCSGYQCYVDSSCGSHPEPTTAPTNAPGGVTLSPGVPSPTPPPGGSSCTADCGGETCGEDLNSNCTSDAQCASGYTCNLATSHCQLCTTPGLSCCTWCVPQGWGCESSNCTWVKNYKKVACKDWNTSTCYNCPDINGGGDCAWAGEGTVSCSGAAGGNSCNAVTCPVRYSSCYQECPVNPTPTPIPVCSVNTFNVAAGQSCGDLAYNLSWSTSNPNEANYLRTFYHNGVNWYETGFSPASPLSTSATQNTKSTLSYQAGGFNFLFLDPAVLEMLTAGIELRDEGGLWYTGDASGIVGAGSRASQGLDFEELWNLLQDNRKGAGWPDRPCIASGVRKLSRR